MEENIDGLPDVDLSAITRDLSNQDEEKTGEEPKPKKSYGLETTPYKTTEDLVKGYKELQALTTKTSQEKKQIEEQLAQLREQANLSRSQGVQIPESFNDTFYDNPAQAIQTAVLASNIQEILEDELEKDQSSFQRRYSLAQSVIQQYPNLSKSARGVKKAFELGDRLYKEELKNNTNMLMKDLFGEDFSEEGIARLREFVKGDKQIKDNNNSNAYMPDTDTAAKHRTDKKVDVDNVTEAARKGDVDGVVKNIFANIMAD